MALLDVIEVLAQSDTSWEDAAQDAIQTASKTVRGIQSIYIKEFQAVVENDKITQYRVDAKITFVLQGDYGMITSPSKRWVLGGFRGKWNRRR
jgi:flavin-binding protein dodecin